MQIIGETVTVTVDRPLGSHHPRYPDLRYPVNYGYIEGVPGGDGEWQDAYLLGLDRPVHSFTGTVTAILRLDDAEDKWIVVPDGCLLSDAQILDAVHFQERYFHSILIRK